jgi:phosphoglycerol transferase
MEDGIVLSQAGLPSYIASTYGMSFNEPWGRWTDGDVVVFRFATPLPRRFSVELSGGAFGANIGRPVKLRVGSAEREVVFDGGPFERVSTVKAEFDNTDGSDTIVILLPSAQAASEHDRRRLGLALRSIKVAPTP